MIAPALLEVEKIPIEDVVLFLLTILCIIIAIMIDGNRD